MSLGPGHYTLSKDGGDAIWFLGGLMTVKASRTQTGNAFAIVEFTLPPGFAPPPHIHHMEDEAFYILEGAVTGFCGDQRWEAAPGRSPVSTVTQALDVCQCRRLVIGAT